MSERTLPDEAIEKLSKAYHDVREQISRVIVGQNEVIDQLLIALFSRNGRFQIFE